MAGLTRTQLLAEAAIAGFRAPDRDVRLLADDGSVVPATPVFLQTSGTALWASGHGPQPVRDSELQRTGRIALLTPGEEVPLTVAWRDADGEPVRIDYGDGSLPIEG